MSKYNSRATKLFYAGFYFLHKELRNQFLKSILKLTFTNLSKGSDFSCAKYILHLNKIHQQLRYFGETFEDKEEQKQTF